MIKFQWTPFEKLTCSELYDVLKLRSEVFVVEQNCAYSDPDGRDPFALHLLGKDEIGLAAYLRVFPPTEVENYLVFGRVVTAMRVRSKGYGKHLLKEFFDYCEKNYPNTTIKCSAQYYLKKFYESFGLQSYGDMYHEDNIPHIAMKKDSR